jgi:hypothetical protein
MFGPEAASELGNVILCGDPDDRQFVEGAEEECRDALGKKGYTRRSTVVGQTTRDKLRSEF